MERSVGNIVEKLSPTFLSKEITSLNVLQYRSCLLVMKLYSMLLRNTLNVIFWHTKIYSLHGDYVKAFVLEKESTWSEKRVVIN